MTYNIFSPTAPKMPQTGKGTKFIKFILSQASSDMREPLVPMAIPALAAHLCGVTFVYSDNKSYELCGQMGHLIGPSGIGKAQLTHLVEAIMRPFRSHDETELKKLVDWQRQMKTKSANKEKPERPDVSFWFPPADVTNAAFIQNAMALEKQDQRTQYINLPEVEMARLGDMTDDDMLWELSHRSIFSAWKKGAVLWILNDQTWTRSIGEFVEWFCYYDLWSKVNVFGDMFSSPDLPSEAVKKNGPKNMLDDLNDSFNELQLEALRLSVGKNKEGTKHLLNVWKSRGFNQEGACPHLLPSVRPPRGRDPPREVDKPLQAPARCPVRPRLPKDIQVALAARGQAHHAISGRALG